MKTYLPFPGVIVADDASGSYSLLKGFRPRGGCPYAFDPDSGTFAVGEADAGVAEREFGAEVGRVIRSSSPHERLAFVIGADFDTAVAGQFRRGPSGEIVIDEQTGHFNMNWDDGVRADIVECLGRWTGQRVVLEGWGG